MKYFLVVILLSLSSTFGDLDRIATINKLKKEAKTAYNEGDYPTAIRHYQYLLDSMEVSDDNIQLNLANAYYQSKDTTNALSNYQLLTESKDNVVQSVAQQQLGIMANRNKEYKEALAHFKESLRADPTNEESRYNYELLKKVLKDQKKDENKDDQQDKDKKDQQDKKDKEEQQKKDQEKKDQQNKDQESKDQEKQDQQEQDQKKEGEGEEKDQKDQQDKKEKGEKEKAEEKKEQQQPQEGEQSDEKKDKQEQMNSVADKLKEMNMSEEKAQMILEALKNKEIQYYQQNKRKATKGTDSDKPDW